MSLGRWASREKKVIGVSRVIIIIIVLIVAGDARRAQERFRRGQESSGDQERLRRIQESPRAGQESSEVSQEDLLCLGGPPWRDRSSKLRKYVFFCVGTLESELEVEKSINYCGWSSKLKAIRVTQARGRSLEQ
jgi:hypothetical protein